MAAIHRKSAITGIGETEYSKASGMSTKALQLQAALRAIEDAGLKPRDVDGIIPNGAANSASAEDFGNNLGLPEINFTVELHMGGASGTAGVFTAAMAVASGVARHVLVISGRNGYSGARVSQARASRGLEPATAKQSMSLEFEAPFGVMVPMQYYSLLARRHMFQYGTTSQQLGAIAVTMRKHAALNDKAIMRHPITLEDHQASRMMSDPFHLFDCCIETDGATAILVSSAEAASDTRHKPVYILGGGFAHPDSPGCVSTRPDLTLLGLSKAAPKGFAMAGIAPKEVKLACLYDAFTIVPILHLENLG
ncbi:transporter, partial [Dehalococcoidia bacterium]|nr:transporter [Dehalococcoidia bacterium]